MGHDFFDLLEASQEAIGWQIPNILYYTNGLVEVDNSKKRVSEVYSKE